MEIGDWRSMWIRSKIVEIGDWRSIGYGAKKWRLEIGDRYLRFGYGAQKVEIGDWRSDSGDWRLEIGDCRLVLF